VSIKNPNFSVSGLESHVHVFRLLMSSWLIVMLSSAQILAVFWMCTVLNANPGSFVLMLAYADVSVRLNSNPSFIHATLSSTSMNISVPGSPSSAVSGPVPPVTVLALNPVNVVSL